MLFVHSAFSKKTSCCHDNQKYTTTVISLHRPRDMHVAPTSLILDIYGVRPTHMNVFNRVLFLNYNQCRCHIIMQANNSSSIFYSSSQRDIIHIMVFFPRFALVI